MRSNIVAVKVTKRFSSEKVMRDFQNEMSIMSEVAHPNIVRLYGIIREGERVCAVTAQEFNSIINKHEYLVHLKILDYKM